MESLVKLEAVREGFDRQRALKPVDVRFEEFNGKPLRVAIVVINGERVPVVTLSDIADYPVYRFIKISTINSLKLQIYAIDVPRVDR